MALPMVDVETLCPNSSSKASRCSSRVRSSLASRCSGSHSRSIAPFLEGLPGMGSGSTSPVSRRLFSQRFMVGIDTEKVFATSSLGLPASTAVSTLNLRSFEYGFMPGGYHICGSILTGAAVRPGAIPYSFPCRRTSLLRSKGAFSSWWQVKGEFRGASPGLEGGQVAVLRLHVAFLSAQGSQHNPLWE